tara:strand:+ start:1559 stop:2518 length:960 start_codon:yes stop_codon:yes gene_type:complete
MSYNLSLQDMGNDFSGNLNNDTIIDGSDLDVITDFWASGPKTINKQNINSYDINKLNIILQNYNTPNERIPYITLGTNGIALEDGELGDAELIGQDISSIYIGKLIKLKNIYNNNLSWFESKKFLDSSNNSEDLEINFEKIYPESEKKIYIKAIDNSCSGYSIDTLYFTIDNSENLYLDSSDIILGKDYSLLPVLLDNDISSNTYQLFNVFPREGDISINDTSEVFLTVSMEEINKRYYTISDSSKVIIIDKYQTITNNNILSKTSLVNEQIINNLEIESKKNINLSNLTYNEILYNIKKNKNVLYGNRKLHSMNFMNF